MNQTLHMTSAGVLLSVAIAIALAPGIARAERIEHSGVKSNPRVISRNVMPINDPVGREIGTELVLSELHFTNSPIKVKEEWVYSQFDYVGGTGPHWGIFVDVLESGEQTVGRFEGNTVMKANPDGSWVMTWEGTHRYTGGTGKFKNVKGGGTYKGKATSTGEYTELTEEIMEY